MPFQRISLFVFEWKHFVFTRSFRLLPITITSNTNASISIVISTSTHFMLEHFTMVSLASFGWDNCWKVDESLKWKTDTFLDGRLKYFMNVNSSNVRVLFLWGENIGMKDESHLQLEINQMAGHRIAQRNVVKCA